MIAPFKSLWKVTEERIKNPIVGAFAISWIICNWRPVAFFIFSTKDVESKISLLSAESSSFWFLFIIPLISSSLYTLSMPWITYYYDRAVFGAAKKSINADVEKREYREMANKNMKSENLIARVDALEMENSNLLTSNTTLEKDLGTEKSKNLSLSLTISDLEKNISVLVADKDLMEKEVSETKEEVASLIAEREQLQEMTSDNLAEYRRELSQLASSYGDHKRFLHNFSELLTTGEPESSTVIYAKIQAFMKELNERLDADASHISRGIKRIDEAHSE